MHTNYKLLTEQLQAFAKSESNWVPVLSNASALLNGALKDINWAGFYLMDQGSLVLGPFQGKVACIRIQPGKGVCGTAVSEDTPQLVTDVHQFPGHIACDSASNSEVVVPIHKNGNIVGVLDIDSPSVGRFSQEDLEGLQQFVAIIEEMVDFTNLTF